MVLAPARPAAVTVGSMGRKEINYAISKGKKIIAVDTEPQIVLLHSGENMISMLLLVEKIV